MLARQQQGQERQKTQERDSSSSSPQVTRGSTYNSRTINISSGQSSIIAALVSDQSRNLQAEVSIISIRDGTPKSTASMAAGREAEGKGSSSNEAKHELQ
jgi:hypothetical protein